jgi:hypothetical protein
MYGTQINDMKQQATRLYTTQQVADLWNISRWTVFALVKKGEIRPIVGIGKGWMWDGTELGMVKFERL